MSDLAQGAIDKRAVAMAFSRAASTYDDLARLQHQVGSELLQDMMACQQNGERPDVFLDLGAGTGARTSDIQTNFTPQQIVSLDIAQGMCRRIAEEEGAHPVAADFDALPLRDACVSMVYANFALQWSNNISKLLEGIHSALSTEGVFGFTTLLEGTLFEVNNAWLDVDVTKKNIAFPRECHWEEAVKTYFSVLNWRVDTIVDRHPDIKSLLASIKGIGAANHSAERSRQTLSRSQYQEFICALEKNSKKPERELNRHDAIDDRSKNAGFGASYCVLRVVCQKNQAN